MKTTLFCMSNLFLIVSMIWAQNIIPGRIIAKFEKNIVTRSGALRRNALRGQKIRGR